MADIKRADTTPAHLLEIIHLGPKAYALSADYPFQNDFEVKLENGATLRCNFYDFHKEVFASKPEKCVFRYLQVREVTKAEGPVITLIYDSKTENMDPATLSRNFDYFERIIEAFMEEQQKHFSLESKIDQDEEEEEEDEDNSFPFETFDLLKHKGTDIVNGLLVSGISRLLYERAHEMNFRSLTPQEQRHFIKFLSNIELRDLDKVKSLTLLFKTMDLTEQFIVYDAIKLKAFLEAFSKNTDLLEAIKSWGEKDDAAKLQKIKEFAALHAQVYGYEAVNNFIVDHDHAHNKTAHAFYNPKNHTITFPNSNMLKDTDFIVTITAIFHELTHAYQHILINHFGYSSAEAHLNAMAGVDNMEERPSSIKLQAQFFVFNAISTNLELFEGNELHGKKAMEEFYRNEPTEFHAYLMQLILVQFFEEIINPNGKKYSASNLRIILERANAAIPQYKQRPGLGFLKQYDTVSGHLI